MLCTCSYTCIVRHGYLPDSRYYGSSLLCYHQGMLGCIVQTRNEEANYPRCNLRCTRHTNSDWDMSFERIKKWYHVLLYALLWIWQLPQNLLGLILSAYIIDRGGQKYICSIKIKGKVHKVRFVYLRTFPGGITLGEYIVIGGRWSENDVRHEYGHVRQSRILGWLYLVVIGIASLLHACLHHLSKNKKYSHFWTEKWAEKLGGIL